MINSWETVYDLRRPKFKQTKQNAPVSIRFIQMILNDSQDLTTTNANAQVLTFDTNRHLKIHNLKPKTPSQSKNTQHSVKILKSFYKKDAAASVTKSFLNLDENYITQLNLDTFASVNEFNSTIHSGDSRSEFLEE